MRRPADPAAALRFRPMRTADLDRVVDIEKDGFRNPWSRQLLERELGHAWSSTLLAVEDGPGGEVVLGFIVFWLVHDELHVLNIATALEARRRGVGRALMLEGHRIGRGRGAVLATLEVRRSNVAAIELYRSLGYRQVGIRPGYYAEEGEDAVVMTADLP
ncbi:ribosomal-protein-alanine acetyltransferase [Anaeromyxobacter sp. K]|uniref:ribosomal protein S18-alanine N-acetyltransferase n=1 Tax=Anaeromyxobacter sp. (strain K) TaxID=447217 RepID=UPI00015F8EA3|nr:ribosomal protein S18-alanine N-acetyltransferase [Anaeromyxobacter sp. K]ACG73792.1 ribosomal-protein-alanine acetyltransferase [Anaeromyxobacter sp. K]